MDGIFHIMMTIICSLLMAVLLAMKYPVTLYCLLHSMIFHYSLLAAINLAYF